MAHSRNRECSLNKMSCDQKSLTPRPACLGTVGLYCHNWNPSPATYKLWTPPRYRTSPHCAPVSMSSSVWAALIEYHRLSGLETQTWIPHRPGDWRVPPRSRGWQSPGLVRAHFLVQRGHLLTVSSRSRGDKRALRCLFRRAFMSLRGLCPLT